MPRPEAKLPPARAEPVFQLNSKDSRFGFSQNVSNQDLHPQANKRNPTYERPTPDIEGGIENDDEDSNNGGSDDDGNKGDDDGNKSDDDSDSDDDDDDLDENDNIKDDGNNGGNNDGENNVYGENTIANDDFGKCICCKMA